jgi:hypothetical protein
MRGSRSPVGSSFMIADGDRVSCLDNRRVENQAWGPTNRACRSARMGAVPGSLGGHVSGAIGQFRCPQRPLVGGHAAYPFPRTGRSPEDQCTARPMSRRPGLLDLWGTRGWSVCEPVRSLSFALVVFRIPIGSVRHGTPACKHAHDNRLLPIKDTQHGGHV